ncbi:hypothetical protein [Actinoplanes sp. NPDC026619]|uniref:hypothetical protein n=1 Tax=Actinoplanes sp. NPDC026619 TaxID=3155798 RepID=UPI0033FF67B7
MGGALDVDLSVGPCWSELVDDAPRFVECLAKLSGPGGVLAHQVVSDLLESLQPSGCVAGSGVRLDAPGVQQIHGDNGGYGLSVLGKSL